MKREVFSIRSFASCNKQTLASDPDMCVVIKRLFQLHHVTGSSTGGGLI